MAEKEREFPLPVNGARGEVALWVGDVPLVIAAEMEGLSVLSTRLECKSIQDLFTRLSGAEVAATRAAIPSLTVRGEPAKALEKLKLKHFAAIAEAFARALSHHFEDDEGNAGAAEGKK
ncbi:hypothetical protein C5748_17085 [Phyllobacterium phragmitis]|uniref:Uncharacterized protein n=1 Tax=Phyllobacterium phragmitis TaxID=2670329 RepID=A0A2S9INS3_9HYPH|nr:hypothetical protein [Phyllobacterium phragmitis]PRD42180.1 hypothetical protein C5748_17085 [Phyllobacterium phragmitis]